MKSLSAVQNDHLEAIYRMTSLTEYVRLTDLARTLSLSKPSVYRAVNALKKDGYVKHEPYGAIGQTEEGKKLGGSIYERKRVVKRFLNEVLKLPETTAEQEASQLLAVMSEEVYASMERYFLLRKSENKRFLSGELIGTLR